MEHVVFFPGPDGSPAFRRFSSRDEAVRFVEHLRNAEGVSEVSLHALTPVPVAFRAYYKVEVPGGEVAAVPEQPAAPAEPAADLLADMALAASETAAAPVADADAVPAEAAAANGKRSLGFFAH